MLGTLFEALDPYASGPCVKTQQSSYLSWGRKLPVSRPLGIHAALFCARVTGCSSDRLTSPAIKVAIDPTITQIYQKIDCLNLPGLG